MLVSQAPVEQRLQALIDSGTAQSSKANDEFLLAEASIGAQRVLRTALRDCGLDSALGAAVVDRVPKA
ncbi:MAG: hypothetical protein ACREUQ_06085 [Burkholderiales bacterium]